MSGLFLERDLLDLQGPDTVDNYSGSLVRFSKMLHFPARKGATPHTGDNQKYASRHKHNAQHVKPNQNLLIIAMHNQSKQYA